MSNSNSLRKDQPQTQNKCVRCRRQVPEEIVLCERCQDLGYCIGQPITEDLQGSSCPTKDLTIPEVNNTTGGAKFKTSPKKKKKKKKKGQGTNLLSGQSISRTESGKEESYNVENKSDETTKVDVKFNSRDSFGEGWWKSNSKVKKDQTDGISKKQTTGLEGAARLKYKDFYGDSEEEEENTVDNDEGNCKQKKPSASGPTAEVEKELSGLEIQNPGTKASGKDKKDAKSDRSSSKQGTCSYCHKKGFILNCSRCQLSSYCNKECQKSHYPQHKDICRRKEIFNKAESKIPDVLKERFSISTSLQDLPKETEYYKGHRALVLAEIIGPSYHLFRPSIEIRDLFGCQCHIIFYIDSNIYLHKTANGSTSYPLAMCFLLAKFILLLDTHFHHFFDGTVGIRINSLSKVHFILEN